MQQELGSSAQILYFNGAEGDISIGHKSDLSAVGVIAPFRTFEKAEELGVRLAEAVSDSLPMLENEPPVLKIVHRLSQTSSKKIRAIVHDDRTT